MTDCCGGVADLTWSVHGPVATEVGTQTGLAGSKERERLVRQAVEAARLYLSLAPWLFSNPLFRRPVSRVVPDDPFSPEMSKCRNSRS